MAAHDYDDSNFLLWTGSSRPLVVQLSRGYWGRRPMEPYVIWEVAPDHRVDILPVTCDRIVPGDVIVGRFDTYREFATVREDRVCDILNLIWLNHTDHERDAVIFHTVVDIVRKDYTNRLEIGSEETNKRWRATTMVDGAGGLLTSDLTMKGCSDADEGIRMEPEVVIKLVAS